MKGAWRRQIDWLFSAGVIGVATFACAKELPQPQSAGARTFVRVTLGTGYERPAYIHVFADHYRAPWYQHLALGRGGAAAALAPQNAELLKSGERTAWCDLSPTVYPEDGAMLYFTARHTYAQHAERLRATFEFATAPDEKSIVRTLTFDNRPASAAIYLPPDLLAPENRALLKTDREIAEETGRRADSFLWPTHGKRPQRFPFFVTAQLAPYGQPLDVGVLERELKTLSYFGFLPDRHRHVGGVWHMKDDSYCQPDLAKMEARAAEQAAAFRRDGGKAEDIVFCALTDEPCGQALDKIANDAAYGERFRAWLTARGVTPAELLVPDWGSVRIVAAAEREAFPALYYFSQRFRARALGDFMAAQRKALEKAYGRELPTLANFSDGAIYKANFYEQGVDYFELLDAPDQNAIWGEDWANLSSTYQCAAFNVDLMRAAARTRGQVIGHYLVAHAGRKPWDIKLKATGELARGVKILSNFCYGPSWATHEGGPYWRSHVWSAKPDTWVANAALTREVGAVEDRLLTAMPAPAKVALLYSSASDIWTLGGNLAYGFDRMHTWLALAHAQIPVDVVSERQVSEGLLEGYQVCYLSGPNLARPAADKLKAWVRGGGTLWLTAGAASLDEYNRPLTALEELVPAARQPASEPQKFTSSGRYLTALSPQDEARWAGGSMGVLAVKQALQPRAGAAVLATFKDGAPALVSGPFGKGKVFCAGFLPALDYIRQALAAREALQKKVKAGAPLSDSEKKDAGILERSANPWRFPADVREFLLAPVRAARVVPPLACSAPLVDAVVMRDDAGLLIPLANYTLEPLSELKLAVRVSRPVARAESACLGALRVQPTSPSSVEITLPLDCNDFVTLTYQ